VDTAWRAAGARLDRFRTMRNAISTEKHEHPEGAVNPVTREDGACLDGSLLSDY
jgi:hypothetical protein